MIIIYTVIIYIRTCIIEVWHKIFDYPTDVSVQERLIEPPNYSHEMIVNRLVNYHRHIGGIKQAYKTVYKTVNGDQPKSDVFSQGKGMYLLLLV